MALRSSPKMREEEGLVEMLSEQAVPAVSLPEDEREAEGAGSRGAR